MYKPKQYQLLLYTRTFQKLQVYVTSRLLGYICRPGMYLLSGIQRYDNQQQKYGYMVIFVGQVCVYCQGYWDMIINKTIMVKWLFL